MGYKDPEYVKKEQPMDEEDEIDYSSMKVPHGHFQVRFCNKCLTLAHFKILAVLLLMSRNDQILDHMNICWIVL